MTFGNDISDAFKINYYIIFNENVSRLLNDPENIKD